MKEVSLQMNDAFKIEVLFHNKMYQLENNSTLLNIECDVDEEMAYKLHIEHKAEKSLLLMDKGENGISKLLNSAYITENGSYYLQVEGIKDDYRIISNTIKLEVGGFINADYEPTPEEQSLIDEALIKVSTMDSKVVELNSRVDEMYARADSGEFNGKDGADGKDGLNGKDGYTPIKGVDYFDGKDGEKGEKGDKGETGANGLNGTDGFSPSAKAERVSDGVVVTITDKQGTTTAKVYDGQGGAGGDVTKQYVDEGLALKQDKTEMDKYALKSDIPTVDVNKAYVDTQDGNLSNRCDGLANQIEGLSNQLSVEVDDIWDELDSRPTDIQINGTSILDENKVANIPYASKDNYGVIRATSQYGYDVSTSGYLSAVVYTQEELSPREDRTFISKGTLENRLATLNEWVELLNIEIEETVQNIALNKSLVKRELLILFEVTTQTVLNSNIYLYTDGSTTQLSYACVAPNLQGNNRNTTQALVTVISDTEMIVNYAVNYVGVENTVQNANRTGRVPIFESKNRLELHNPNGFPIGTKVRVLTR